MALLDLVKHRKSVRDFLDVPVEAKKSASSKADSSVFSYDFEFQVGRTGLEPVTP